MSSTLSLSSSYVSSATNSFSDDIFGYVILTSTTVAVNSITATVLSENLVNFVVPSTVTNAAGNNYTVTQLNSNAFLTDTPISTISIPNTITSMFYQTFVSSASLFNPTGPIASSVLTSINLYADVDGGGSSNLLYTDSYGILYASSKSDGVFDLLFAAPPLFDDSGYTIPSNVTTIAAYAFVNSTITSLVIPENVTSIGTYAFFQVFLESLTIEGVILDFGSQPFFNQYQSETLTNLICKGYSNNESYGVTTAKQFNYSMALNATITVTASAYGEGIKNTFESMMTQTGSDYNFTFNYIPESTSDGLGSSASSGQTELRNALAMFSFLNSFASVNYDNRSGNVSVVANEDELIDLGNNLEQLSMPHRITGLSVSYSKAGRMYSYKLDNIVNKINFTNVGKMKSGRNATYFDDVAGDTDDYTERLSVLAGVDFGSFGCLKTYTMNMIDSEKWERMNAILQ